MPAILEPHEEGPELDFNYSDGMDFTAKWQWFLRPSVDTPLPDMQTALAEAHALTDASVTVFVGDLLLERTAYRNKLKVKLFDLTADTFEVTVEYGPPNIDEDDAAIEFDTSGATAHITQAIASIARYAASGSTAPDVKGAIGVTKDSVEGTEIQLPTYKWSETISKKHSEVTQAYRLELANLTGKTNSGSFRGCATGTVLSRGSRGSRRGNGNWEITHSYEFSPALTGITIGDITGIAKGGWEYLWVRYEDAVDGSSAVKRPISVHVDQVYRSASFGAYG
jgi:hypothetical protein